MSTSEEKKTGSVRRPKYVLVYDQLYSKITSGEFPEGMWLPSEPDLAKQMGVSRMTLRQALGILQDDHLVKNIRGKGNMVLGSHAYRKAGLETFSNPIHLCCKEPITDIELNYRIDLPSNYYVQSLDHKVSAVVACNRWYKNQDTAVAYSFSFFPIELAALYDIDLNDPECVKDFIEGKLYQVGTDSAIAISHTNTGNFMPVKYRLSGNGSYMMFFEKIIDEGSNRILSVSKHYIPSDICETMIYTNKISK